MIITITPENLTESQILDAYAQTKVNQFVDPVLPSADAIIKWLKNDMNIIASNMKAEEVINSAQADIDAFKVV